MVAIVLPSGVVLQVPRGGSGGEGGNGGGGSSGASLRVGRAALGGDDYVSRDCQWELWHVDDAGDELWLKVRLRMLPLNSFGGGAVAPAAAHACGARMRMHAARAPQRSTVSRRQICGSPASPCRPHAQVRGGNLTVVTAAAGNGAEGAATTRTALDRGDGAVVAPGASFALLGRERSTTCRVVAEACITAASAGAGAAGDAAAVDGGSSAPTQMLEAAGVKRPRSGGSSSGGGSGGSSGDAAPPAAQRPRRADDEAAADPAAAAAAAEPWLVADCPVRLQRVPGLPARDNIGALGADWREVVAGPIRTAFIVSAHLVGGPDRWRARA